MANENELLCIVGQSVSVTPANAPFSHLAVTDITPCADDMRCLHNFFTNGHLIAIKSKYGQRTQQLQAPDWRQ